MSINSSLQPAAAPSVMAALLPIIAVVFIAFLVIGLALSVLPLYVHQDLGLGAFVVGLVAGAQFVASCSHGSGRAKEHPFQVFIPKFALNYCLT